MSERMKSIGLAFIFLIANAASAVAQDAGIPMPSAPRVPQPGEFRRGELSGRCYRGNNLEGFKRETCRLLIINHVWLGLERTSSGIAINVTNGPCGEPRRAATTIPAAALNLPDRDKHVADAMRATVARVMAGCVNARPYEIDEADLAAVLKDMDGLKDAPPE